MNVGAKLNAKQLVKLCKKEKINAFVRVSKNRNIYAPLDLGYLRKRSISYIFKVTHRMIRTETIHVKVIQ